MGQGTPFAADPGFAGSGHVRTLLALPKVHAAGIYARCRWSGITIRSANDCLIAAECIELDQPLLHRDLDFTRIAAIEPALQLIDPGPHQPDSDR